jgi:hypothetical protein
MNNPRFWIILCVCVILIKYMDPAIILFILLLFSSFFFFGFLEGNKKQRISDNKIAAEKREEETRKRVKEREQAEKQAEEWVNRRRRLIIAKGPEINKITRSVFGNIRYFRINRINGELCFSTKIGDFSIYNSLSKDYESLLGELEEMKKRREYMLANKVSSRTNIDSRLSKSYSRKSRSNNNDDYPTDDDINSVDGGPPSEAYDDDDDG